MRCSVTNKRYLTCTLQVFIGDTVYTARTLFTMCEGKFQRKVSGLHIEKVVYKISARQYFTCFPSYMSLLKSKRLNNNLSEILLSNNRIIFCYPLERSQWIFLRYGIPQFSPLTALCATCSCVHKYKHITLVTNYCIKERCNTQKESYRYLFRDFMPYFPVVWDTTSYEIKIETLR